MKKMKATEFWNIMDRCGVSKGDYIILLKYIETMYWHWYTTDKEDGREILASIWESRLEDIRDELEKRGCYL